jgi:hypothetical protein
MNRTALGILGLLVVVPALWALDDPKDKDKTKPKSGKPPTPQEAYQAIEKEYQKAQQDFFKAYQAAKTNEEKQKIYEKQYPKVEDYASRFLELAEKHAKDPVAEKALTWIVQNAWHTPPGQKAMGILVRDHIESKNLGPVCQSLVYSSSPEAEKSLRQILEKNPHKEVRGQACFSLAQYLKNQSERGGPNQEKVAKEAENFFDLTIEKYGDIKSFQGTLADNAKSALFEIRHLGIGKAPPDIEGEDIDGKKLKLSDYLGKVVVLDFWGNW